MKNTDPAAGVIPDGRMQLSGRMGEEQMKIRRVKYLVAFLFMLIAGGSLFTNTAMAASAEVSLTADAVEVTEGDVFFVYITIKSDQQFGDFEASLTYDDELLEYQGGSSKIKGSSGFLKISDTDVVTGVKERKYTLKFETLKVGISNIEFSDSIMVYELESGDAMPVSSNSLTMNAIAPPTASNNTKLKTLQISPSKLTPEFSPDLFEYTTEIGYDTEQLIIVALPEDEKATVTISGNDSLAVGENKVNVTVVAESGDNIEYSINVTRDAAPEVTAPPVTNLPEDDGQGTFELERVNGEIYAVYSGRYQLLEPGNDVEIPKGYEKTKLMISDISFTAYYPKNDLDSEFLLVYAKNELGEASFYRYDRVERTLQRFIAGQDTIENQDSGQDTQKDLITSEQYRSNLTKAAVVIGILCAVCVLLIALMIRMMLKHRGYHEDDLD